MVVLLVFVLGQGLDGVGVHMVGHCRVCFGGGAVRGLGWSRILLCCGVSPQVKGGVNCL